MARWKITRIDGNGGFMEPVIIESDDPPTDEWTVECIELEDEEEDEKK